MIIGLFFALAIQADAQDPLGPEATNTAPSEYTIVHIAIGVSLALGIASLLFDIISSRSFKTVEVLPGIRTTSSRLELPSGGGCAALFGTIFTAAGLFVILMGLTDPGLTTGFRVGTVFFGIPFLLFGLAITTVRNSTVLDRTTDSFSDSYAIFSLPVYKKQRRLGESTHLRIQRQTESNSSGSSGSRSRPSYPVTLCFRHGEGSSLYTSTDVFASRATAEHIAKFLHLPLHDETEKARRIRQPEELDTPVALAPIAAHSPLAAPSKPNDSRILVKVSGPTHTLTFPPPPTYRPRLRITHLFVAYFFAAGVNNFFHLGDPKLVIGLAVVAVPTVLFLFSYIAYRLRKRHFEVITITPDTLQLQRRRTFRKPKYELPAADIEELLVNTEDFTEDRQALATLDGMVKNRVVRKLLGGFTKKFEAHAANQFYNRPALIALIARGDHGTLRFGQGLTHEEAHYALTLILNGLRR